MSTRPLVFPVFPCSAAACRFRAALREMQRTRENAVSPECSRLPSDAMNPSPLSDRLSLCRQLNRKFADIPVCIVSGEHGF